MENFVVIKENVHKSLIYLVLFVLLITAGLRYETGVDWYVYSQYFENAETVKEQIKDPEFFSFEPGFVVLCAIVKSFGGNIQVLFFIVETITICFLINALKFYTNKIVTALLVYFCVQFFLLDMSGMRQGIAVNSFFYATTYLLGDKKRKYFLTIFFACLFHISAVFLFPLYFVIKRKYLTSTLAIFSAIGVFVFILNLKWIGLIMKFLTDFFGNSLIGLKFALYASDNWSSSRSLSLGFFMNIIMLSIVLINKKNIEKFKGASIIINMFILNIAIYNFFYEIVEISIRLRAYFLIANVVMFVYIFMIYKIMLNKTIAFSFITFYCFYIGRIYFLQSPDGIAYNPYQNYLMYKILDLKSTGHERLKQHEKNFDRGRN